MSDPPRRVLWTIAGMLTALAIGSLLRWIEIRKAPPDVAAARIGSLKTWWVLALLLSAGICIGRIGVMLLFAAGSILALREYVTITQLKFSDRGGTAVVFGATLANYAAVGIDSVYWMMPTAVLIVLGAWMSSVGRTDDYIRSTAGLYWGWVVFAFAPGHALLLYNLPPETLGAGGPAGAILLLLILTAVNDIAQALVGRRVGRHRITPIVSPGKTWEGFLGGAIVSTVLALILMPQFAAFGDRLQSTSVPAVSFFHHVQNGCIGLLVAVSGFFGDIDISAVKRDVGVKDGSQLLPGQGGMIDRIDSLTFTAPLYYFMLKWLCGS
jgi:phosphatidate cytidylyltransferase